ncbi:MAG: DEAD/DEAH box helicase, partial [Clostridiales bacterium]|nr:DEAD/DEAH box helicase [Clostridiales bacterium]
RQQSVGAMMYDYAPSTLSIQTYATELLEEADMIVPAPEELERVSLRTTLPQDETQLHSLLMAEGDLMAGELEIPIEWLESLAHQQIPKYIEPGLWISAEQEQAYEAVLNGQDTKELSHILRRALRYRGAQSMEQLMERYLLPNDIVRAALEQLVADGKIIEADGIYYHAQLYHRARKETIKNKRKQIVTVPASHYAALLAIRSEHMASAKDHLEEVVISLCDYSYPMDLWENVILPSRVTGYRPDLLDALLAKGTVYWKMGLNNELSFHRYEDMDWDSENEESLEELDENETAVYQYLRRRGATFLQALSHQFVSLNVNDILLSLAQKGLVHADSFVPVRQYLNRSKIEKATVRQRVNVKVAALTAGRWEVSYQLKEMTLEEQLVRQFDRVAVISRETVSPVSWQAALEVLRVWEYTGRVRRGYFVEGLSGIQFIREEDYYKTSLALQEPVDRIVWMNAVDPNQPWGKCLKHMEERNFLNVATTLVALQKGEVVAVLERSGKVLRCFRKEIKDVLDEFVMGFQKRCFYPKLNRIVIKEYPTEIEDSLKSAGFVKEIKDYVIYRS